MEIRTLRTGEREALLDLLDGWDVEPGWRGRDFFGRYVLDDPTFRDENVWVAADAGRLLSCVQVFPRAMRIAGAAVPTGGIGSVYTRPEARGSGAASALLRRSVEAMRERGFALSLLFASRTAFYTRLGWRQWGGVRTIVRPGPPPGPDDEDLSVRSFDPARDLAAVKALHADYSGVRPGSAVRDDALWTASLRNAGNPAEDFLVAERDGRVVAYARATALSGFLMLSELGRGKREAPALARLVRALLVPREADPLAHQGRPSDQVRAFGVAPALLDPELEAALAGAGMTWSVHPDENSFLRCLDVDALAAHVGVAPASGESPEAFLRRLLPPERFAWWVADRF